MTVPDDQLLELSDEPVVPLDPGEIVQGKYRVGETVGIGGMAAVVAAHHLELDQPVAIKVLLAEHAARPDAVRRFLAEARAAARLKSDHVARVLDVGTTPTAGGAIVPFMVMELLDGNDLDAVLGERGCLPVAEAVEYVLQACDAVAEAHALGIIHRDLKPANLFLTKRRDGAALIKLLDFGISKISARSGAREQIAVTADREMMGSPGYMSPEQVRSAKDVDARADVWALGVILHELLTGAPTFAGDNVADTLVSVLHAPPRSIEKANPEVPAALVEIVMRCLQKKREGRYPSVDALASALAPYRSATPIVAPTIARAAGQAAMADAGVSVRTLREPPKRRVPLGGAVAFAAVGLVLIAIVVFARLSDTTPSDGASAGAPPAPAPALVPESTGEPSATTAVASATPPAPVDELDEAAERSVALKGPKPGAAAGPARPSAFGTKPAATKPPASAAARHRTEW